MLMLGGGCWGLGPGQVTDDGELAMSLMSGIVSGNEEVNYIDENILSTIHI